MYSKRITIRLLFGDWKDINLLAETNNMTVSQYIRYLIKQNIVNKIGRYHHE